MLLSFSSRGGTRYNSEQTPFPFQTSPMGGCCLDSLVECNVVLLFEYLAFYSSQNLFLWLDLAWVVLKVEPGGGGEDCVQ